MNDFTKQELIDLESCVILWDLGPLKDKHYLLAKLKDMIDNYCEHEWENQCCECVDNMFCSKCKKSLID